MNHSVIAAIAAALCFATACNMTNPLMSESPLPYGAPQFDKIKTSHFLPAVEAGIAEGKAEIDAIVANPEEPDFENTIIALEQSGSLLNRVMYVFYYLLSADTNDELKQLAETISPLYTEYSMYQSLNEKLFERVKKIYEKRDSLNLDPDQRRLLEVYWESFTLNGANLSPEDKVKFSEYNTQLSLVSLKFSQNALDATNAYRLNITDEAQLAGLPQFAIDMAASCAAEKGESGWTFDLSAPSYSAFITYSDIRELRKELYIKYNTIALGGEYDNSEICKEIANLRLKIANLLGYQTYAEYALKSRMAKTVDNVESLLSALLEPSLPAAKVEVNTIYQYAKANGFEESELKPWDFSYWSNKYKNSIYTANEELLKPYFKLENCIDAVFGLANKLYGYNFTPRPDIPTYNKDVKVYEVTNAQGEGLSLFYADFFPRASKRSGAWMTNLREQSIRDGVEYRPIVGIVTNFSKPSENTPSLLKLSEFETFLHEFGHALHGISAQGRYASLTGTNVARDFVELPSQIMENFAYESEYLKTFARHYETGEEIKEEYINSIIASKNYNAAYAQVRQLHFSLIDMQWNNISSPITMGPVEAEKIALAGCEILPTVENTCTSTNFSHIFSGGYSAGYYSYKWAEVLEADAWSLFKEKGVFNPEVSSSFLENILSKGSTEDEAVLFRKFRGHDPAPEALLNKLGIKSLK